MRFLFAGGGTAGHINPAIAIANYISGECDAEIKFVGTAEGLETELVPRCGYELEIIKIHGFERSLCAQNFKNIVELPLSIKKSQKIIRDFKPDAVIGTGGYVAGPVLYAAAKMKIPTLIHESNALPGFTTRVLAKYVDTTMLGVADAEQYIKKAEKIVVTGNPVRPSILSVGEFEARRMLELDERPYIVIFGGSLGARDFNKTVVDWISREGLLGKYQILMGTGKLDQYNAVMERFKQNGADVSHMPSVQIEEYIYDMDVALGAANLVISRAGASTLAELTALGRPAILVPSPYVTGNHQEYNARALERAGAAKVILEKDFTSDALSAAVDEIMSDKQTLVDMKNASRETGHTDALEQMFNEIKRIL